ncbi:MAG: tRNA lysidine(34) synthetase TilS [Oscillospiraceae bacterium]|nr:tRNA lysidine(34) synthetase TilS [Oscillospiraceae bacterium]
MINKILRFANDYNMLPDSMLPDCALVLVALSGGVDSMCLLEALLEISKDKGFTVGAAHFNHQLRGDESLRDENFVREYCHKRGVSLIVDSGDVTAFAKEHKLGIEEAAREMRYAFFYETAMETGARYIATAHTADDNAETILLNLIRGAGAAGLSGIPPTRRLTKATAESNKRRALATDTFSASTSSTASKIDIAGDELDIQSDGKNYEVMLIRPMLLVSKGEAMEFLDQKGIEHIEDSSNSSDIYTRNRIRHQIIPIIKDINPSFNEAAAALSTLSRWDDDFLSSLADKYIEDNFCENSTAAKELAALPLAIFSRVVKKLTKGNITFTHIDSLYKLCLSDKPSAKLSLPGMIVIREYEKVIFSDNKMIDNNGAFSTIIIDTDELSGYKEIPGTGLSYSYQTMEYSQAVQWVEGHKGKINKYVTSFIFNCSDICGKMTIRSRCAGDSIKLFGRERTKTLKRLFIERRIPARKRDMIPIVADDVGVLAIYGLGPGDRAVPKTGDNVFLIDFEEI